MKCEMEVQLLQWQKKEKKCPFIQRIYKEGGGEGTTGKEEESGVC